MFPGLNDRVLSLQVFPNLKEDRAQMAARHMKRAALDAALAAQRAATQVAGQPASLPKRLRMDGVDVVELFVSGPGQSLSSDALPYACVKSWRTVTMGCNLRGAFHDDKCIKAIVVSSSHPRLDQGTLVGEPPNR